jgi:acetyl esterase/lipase
MRYLYLLALILTLPLHAAEPDYSRKEDVIYGRKFGMALTMDVFTPKHNAKGIAIVAVMSGGWFSSHDNIGTPLFNGFMQPEIERGFTVFAVVHGSQPRFTIPDAVADINRAVRFIRYHAKDYGIDPDHIGITGGSAGGHLSLMQGVKPLPPSPKSPDPVERVSAEVQAVGCFFPPTDFLNYGEPNKLAWDFFHNWAAIQPPFDFQKQDPKTNGFILLSGEEKKAVAKEVSPIYFVSAKTPPTLIIHGDADVLVPIEQSKRFIEKLKEANVPCHLEIRPGKNHGWPDFGPDEKMFCDWFDKYLVKGSSTQPSP